ncbi:MAG: MJ0042-type zinc finger domain-containing protein [Planctomycetota bacterium]|jgi:predicted Zn finger-like uncharacterized protein
MKTECPHCESRFTARKESVGKKAKCPKCSQPFTIELLVEAPVEAAAKHTEDMKRPDENCSECGVVIGPEQQACVHKGTIVCELCYNKLTDAGQEKTDSSIAVEEKAGTKKSLKTLYFYCWAGTRISAGLAFVLGLLLAIKREVNLSLIATFAVGDILLIFSVLIELALIYKMWAAIYDGRASVSPGKAVVFLLIPIFNIYWALYMLVGFAEDYNSFVNRNKVKAKKLPLLLFLIYAVMFLLSYMAVTIPMICIFAFFGLLKRTVAARPELSWFLFFFVLAVSVGHLIIYGMFSIKTCNAIEALPCTSGEGVPGSSK